MRFIQKNRYMLCFVAVLLFSSVMIVRQFMAGEAEHVKKRENFLLLHELGKAQLSQRSYQLLIQELPGTSDAVLAADLQRTALLIDASKPDLDNLVWKYHISVRNELKKRAERRIAQLIRNPEAQQ